MPANTESDDKYGILEGYTEPDVYNPPPEEQELVGSLRERFDKAYNYRLAWERQWELSRLYLKGQQLVIRNRTTGEVFRLPQDDTHRLIAVNNVLRPTARSLLGKMTRTVPTCTVIPPTGDLTDINGAETADALLYYHRRKEKLDQVYIDIIRDVIWAGTGICKTWWDRDAGREMDHCEECGNISYEIDEEEGPGPCPVCTQQEMLQYQSMIQAMGVQALALGEDLEVPDPPEGPMMQRVKEGDIRVSTVDPRDFFMDYSATSIDEAQWCCHRVALPVSYVRKRFPDKAKYIGVESGIYTEQHVTILQNVANLRSDVRQLDDHVYLFEFHEKATEEHPNGRIIWMANDMILDEIDNPYSEINRLPFYIFYWEKNRGEFWGESFIEQAWPIQRELNILLTQLREHRELTNRPKLFVPLGSKVNVDEIDTTAGQIVHFNPMVGKPFYGDIPGFPNYVYNEEARMKGDIRSLASVTEQEAGITSGEASGRYAAIIEAEAAQQVGPILRYNQGEWIEMHRAILTMCQERYTPERRWTITGHERPQTFSFDKLNLNPGWDVDIQEDDSLSNNHAIRLNQAISLAQLGLFVDSTTGQFDKKTFARMAKLKMPGIGPDTKSTEHAMAASIPDRIAQGMPVQPMPWDDTEVFAEELLAWLRGPGRSDAPQQLVQQVMQIWQQYAQLSQAAMQQQAPQQGQQQAKQGSSQSAPVSNPGASGVLEDAQQTTQQADQAAEGAARTQPQQES
jgi:hypothetical protein